MEQCKNILSKTWGWLTEVMDSIESQLKTGEKFDTQVLNKDFILVLSLVYID